MKHPQTPRVSKRLLGAALVYLASPVDIVPDFIPVFRQLDDLLIVPGLVWLATRLIPRGVVAECRERVRPEENNLSVIGVDS